MVRGSNFRCYHAYYAWCVVTMYNTHDFCGEFGHDCPVLLGADSVGGKARAGEIVHILKRNCCGKWYQIVSDSAGRQVDFSGKSWCGILFKSANRWVDVKARRLEGLKARKLESSKARRCEVAKLRRCEGMRLKSKQWSLRLDAIIMRTVGCCCSYRSG